MDRIVNRSGWTSTASTLTVCWPRAKAYRCFCTNEELEAERALAIAEHKPQVYSGKCRGIDRAASETRAAAQEPFAIRLRIPDAPLRFHDIVRGDVEFASDTVSDPILVRSSGVPVYNYVVTVDDALMEITHVIRGDDHISNTPKQVAIYQAFGWAVPQFAHLSTILGSDRERLSKRHGATSITSFREMGILPEALVNYLALLGWGAEDGKTETFTPDELTKAFKLERVTSSPAIFDFDKLHWLNRHYLKLAAPERILELAWPYFEIAGLLPALRLPNASERDQGMGFGDDSSASAFGGYVGAVAGEGALPLPVRRRSHKGRRRKRSTAGNRERAESASRFRGAGAFAAMVRRLPNSSKLG